MSITDGFGLATCDSRISHMAPIEPSEVSVNVVVNRLDTIDVDRIDV